MQPRSDGRALMVNVIPSSSRASGPSRSGAARAGLVFPLTPRVSLSRDRPGTSRSRYRSARLSLSLRFRFAAGLSAGLPRADSVPIYSSPPPARATPTRLGPELSQGSQACCVARAHGYPLQVEARCRSQFESRASPLAQSRGGSRPRASGSPSERLPRARP